MIVLPKADVDLDTLLYGRVKYNASTWLYESRVGTNEAALAHMEGVEVWVKGSEHYIDALSGYITGAGCWVPPINSNFVTYIALVIILEERYTSEMESLLHLIVITSEAFKMCHQSPQNTMRGRLIDICIRGAPVAYLLIDDNGVILQSNEVLVELMGDNTQALWE